MVAPSKAGTEGARGIVARRLSFRLHLPCPRVSCPCIYPDFNCKAKLTPSTRETTTIFIPTHTNPSSSTLTVPPSLSLNRNP